MSRVRKKEKWSSFERLLSNDESDLSSRVSESVEAVRRMISLQMPFQIERSSLKKDCVPWAKEGRQRARVQGQAVNV